LVNAKKIETSEKIPNSMYSQYGQRLNFWLPPEENFQQSCR